MSRLPVGEVPSVRIAPPRCRGDRAPVTAHSQKRRENTQPMKALELPLKKLKAPTFCLAAELVFGEKWKLPEGVGLAEKLKRGSHRPMIAPLPEGSVRSALGSA